MKKLLKLCMLLLFACLFTGRVAVAEEIPDDTYPTPVLELETYEGNPHEAELSWFHEDYFSYYRSQIFRKAPGQADYTLLAETYGSYYTDDTIVPNGTYFYKVRLIARQGDDLYYGPFSNIVSHTDVVAPTKIESAVSVDGNGAEITVTEIEGVNGYEILYSGTADGTYTRLKDIAAGKASAKTSGQKLGQTYYYKVRSYIIINNVRYYSVMSPPAAVMIVFPAPKIAKIKVKTVTKAELTWKKVNGVKGYYIYQSKNGGKFKKIKTVKGKNKTKATIKKCKNGVYYAYQVVAYGKLNGKTTAGSYSKIKGRYMDKLGYEMEDYYSRYKRIYGKNGKRKYTTDAKARKHMKTITVKTWDINASGKKYTRTWSITVNKYLADTYKQIFKEIYKGKTKFPIHSLGCYNFRTGEHSTGTAIDINPDENYMIDGDKIIAGSFWKPKKNPYSIGINSEVAKIFNKYGFTQGIWGDRRDYMHFSYFGT